MHNAAIIVGELADVIDSTTKQGKEIRTFVIQEEKGLVAIETMQVDKHNAKRGQTVVIRYVCSARQWEGRYFSSARLLEMKVLGGGGPTTKATRDDYEPPPSDRSLPF